MTPENTIRIAAFSALAFALAGCGANGPTTSSTSSQTATVGAAGGTLTTGQATLTIPAGALSTETQVTIREAEPQHGGKKRIELEPRGTNLAQPAELSIEDDANNVKVKIVDDDGKVHDVEIEDRNHHKCKTSVTKLDAMEMEEEQGETCATACAANEECDDGACKPHEEDANAKICNGVCMSGQECDDGVCKPHSEVEVEHGGTAGAWTCPPCASGTTCDTHDGMCKAPHA